MNFDLFGLKAIFLLISVHFAVGNVIPEPPKISTNISETRFYLWTRSNPGIDDYQELFFDDADSISKSFFNPLRKTKVLAHGYTGFGTMGWVERVMSAYLQVGKRVHNIQSDSLETNKNFRGL